MIKKTLFSILLLITSKLNAAFFEQHADGWHWYQDPIPTYALKSKEKLYSASPTELIKAYQQELEKRLHKAWVYPSYKNLQAYQNMQQDLMQRSQNFSQTWMQVVYQNPQLDHTLRSPVNQKSRHIYLDQEKQTIKEMISRLKDQYGLFFFFDSGCKYCYQFAPIVQQFAKNYGWKVIGVSVDGKSIPGFTEFVRDNGLAAKWHVTVLPSLFAVNPTTGDRLPVAHGLTSLDEIEVRIMVLFKNIIGIK